MSIKVKLKKRGRPTTGKGPLMGFRASSDIRAAIVKWAEAQPDTPTISEAIRRLVEIGLTVQTKSKQATAECATELEAKASEKISDPSATQEERIQRRRRLIRGPQEFREDRVDLPETKRGK
jgi:pyocin large subunit-like protein